MNNKKRVDKKKIITEGMNGEYRKWPMFSKRQNTKRAKEQFDAGVKKGEIIDAY